MFVYHLVVSKYDDYLDQTRAEIKLFHQKDIIIISFIVITYIAAMVLVLDHRNCRKTDITKSTSHSKLNSVVLIRIEYVKVKQDGKVKC